MTILFFSYSLKVKLFEGHETAALWVVASDCIVALSLLLGRSPNIRGRLEYMEKGQWRCQGPLSGMPRGCSFFISSSSLLRRKFHAMRAPATEAMAAPWIESTTPFICHCRCETHMHAYINRECIIRIARLAYEIAQVSWTKTEQRCVFTEFQWATSAIGNIETINMLS